MVRILVKVFLALSLFWEGVVIAQVADVDAFVEQHQDLIALRRPIFFSNIFGLPYDADEVESVAWGALYKTAQSYDRSRGASIKSHFSNILRNDLISYARKKRRWRRGKVEDSADGSWINGMRDPKVWRDTSNSMEISKVLADILGELNPIHRDPFMLIEVRRLSYRAAATHLGIPVGTLKTRLYRCRKLLRGIVLERGLKKQDF